MDRVNQVCDMQVTSNEYIPVVVDEKIIRSMKHEEVKYLIMHYDPLGLCCRLN